MGLPDIKFTLNDYTISQQGNNLVVDGPDDAVSEKIGRHFLELLKTDEGFGLITKVALFDDPKEKERQLKRLAIRLGIPPCQKGTSQPDFYWQTFLDSLPREIPLNNLIIRLRKREGDQVGIKISPSQEGTNSWGVNNPASVDEAKKLPFLLLEKSCWSTSIDTWRE